MFGCVYLVRALHIHKLRHTDHTLPTMDGGTYSHLVPTWNSIYEVIIVYTILICINLTKQFTTDKINVIDAKPHHLKTNNTRSLISYTKLLTSSVFPEVYVAEVVHEVGSFETVFVLKLLLE